MSEYQKSWYQHNLLREREKRREYARRIRKEKPENKLYHAAKNRAKKDGRVFSIGLEDVVIPTLCPIFNVELIPNTKYAPSLDRIDNTKGYEKGNIWIISRRANELKKDASLEELMLLVQALQKL